MEKSTVERLTTDASAFLTKDCASLSTNVGIDLIAIAIVAKLECKVTNYSSIKEMIYVKNLIPSSFGSEYELNFSTLSEGLPYFSVSISL